jgi:hypothetical protein
MPMPPSPLRTALHAAAAAAIVGAAFALPTLMAAGVRDASTASAFLGTGDRPFAAFEAPVVDLASLPRIPEPAGPEYSHRPERAEGRAPAPPPPPAPASLIATSAPPTAGLPMIIAAADAFQPPSPDVRRLTRARIGNRDAPPSEAARRARARHRPCDDRVAGIEQVGEGHYRVERSVLDHYTRLSEALKLAAVAWHRGPDGKIDGFAVYRIQCGNPLAQVGLRSGDVIHTINGKRVKSIPHAIVVVAKVKKRDRIHVVGSRRGAPLSITAEVI